MEERNELTHRDAALPKGVPENRNVQDRVG